MVVLENSTEFPEILYAPKQVGEGEVTLAEEWRCIIGNVDDRNREMPVFTDDGLLVPGKTKRIADSTPRPTEEWKGVLPSPIAVFTNEQWKQLQKSPCWPTVKKRIEAGDFTQSRRAA